MEGRSRLGFLDVRRLVAFLALFSGLALLLNILFQVDLRVGLVGMTTILGAIFVFAMQRAGPGGRRAMWLTIGYGAVAGVIGTLAYDIARLVLVAIDPSPYRPFEAIIKFGQLLVGSPGRDAAVILAGSLFHILNGTAFGVAFALAVVGRGHISVPKVALLGTAWGMFLEAFQATLYPGWLGIRYLTEFLTISALGHVVYGTTMATLARSFIRRAWKEEADD